NYIMDNLIAEGKAKPMIIVNPLGYARQGVGLRPDRPQDAAPQGRGAPPAPGTPAPPPGGVFGQDLLEDVIPFVEKTFRTLPGADNRALGGLSMGGGQTIAVGFSHPDTFHWLVVMSAGSANADTTYPDFFKPEITNRKIKLLWMGVGKDDALVGAGAKTLDEALTKANIKHTFRLTDGRHEWVVWRHHLYDVAPLLFKTAGATSTLPASKQKEERRRCRAKGIGLWDSLRQTRPMPMPSCFARQLQRGLSSPARETAGVIGGTRSFVYGGLRIGAERARAHHLAVDDARCGDRRGRDPFLDPLHERRERVERGRAGAAGTVRHAGHHEQPVEIRRRGSHRLHHAFVLADAPHRVQLRIR